MATSIQKLHEMRPVLMAQLEESLETTGHGPLLRPVLALLRPRFEAAVDGWLTNEPARVDEILTDIATSLLNLRSDDLGAAELAGAPVEPGWPELADPV